MDQSQQTQISIEEKKRSIENLLNHTIGTSYYKRYIGAIFWNNISTPINLAITLMSAVNTGQATTGNLISSDTFVKLSIATLILTSINTFFRPNDQMNINNEYSRKWIDFGTKFEEIFLSNKRPNEKYEEYYKLNQDIHKFENTQTINQNCFIDIIYTIVSISCLNGNQTWLKVAIGDCENLIIPESSRTDRHKIDQIIFPERATACSIKQSMDDIPPPSREPLTPQISIRKSEWESKMHDNALRIFGERNIMFKKMPVEENKNDIKDEHRETKLEKKPESISDISLV